MLCTSECVTNALLHGEAPVRVAVSVPDAVLRVEVHDSSPVMPRLSTPSLTRPGGRGVAIMDRISTAWGATPTDDGKTVWFEISTDRLPAITPPPLTIEHATREVLAATCPGDVVEAVTRSVQRWGGSCTAPGERPGQELPVDLTFGLAPPLVPVFPPDSPARTRLERLLPRLIEDARMMVKVLRWGGASYPS